eukprot:14032930-Ditylum_brightwellii.AAC.1
MSSAPTASCKVTYAFIIQPALKPQLGTTSHAMCAITATKIDCIWDKPFIGLLGNGHHNVIITTTISYISLVPYVRGSANGEVCIWDMASWSEAGHIPGAHSWMVIGLVMDLEGHIFCVAIMDMSNYGIWA